MKKIVLVHFHIFKNAGSTIEWILKNNFSKNSISVDSEDPQGIIGFEQILKILEKKPEILSISSHQFRFPIKENPKFEFIPIVFLRHPIDRAISIYHFQRRRTDSDRPGITKAKELSLNDYIKWNLETPKHRAMKNFQVLYLSDKIPTSGVNESDFEIAKQRLKEIRIMGTVDRFDESLVLGEELLKPYFPNIDFSYIRQNVSEERKGELDQNLEQSKKDLDNEIWEQLNLENHFDLMLFEEVNKELDGRLQNIKNYDKKLSDFKHRCEKKIEGSNKIQKILRL